MVSSDIKDHLERYWKICREFFGRGDFALASFLSITLIEEIGKIVILGNRELSGQLDKKGFRDHKRKYVYAVYTTLLNNSRVSRIYGDQEERFARWFSEDKLFEIRNSSLYLELDQNDALVPHKVISRKDASLLVCIAGEVYAEIQGQFMDSDPNEWQRVIQEVDLFREENSNVS